MLQEAADLVQDAGAASPGGGEAVGPAAACRILYRLAHYADGLYRNILVRRGGAA